MSKTTISNIELQNLTNPAVVQLYGLALERYYAYKQGYVPAYRKVGENEYQEIKL